MISTYRSTEILLIVVNYVRIFRKVHLVLEARRPGRYIEQKIDRLVHNQMSTKHAYSQPKRPTVGYIGVGRRVIIRRLLLVVAAPLLAPNKVGNMLYPYFGSTEPKRIDCT